VLFHFEPPPLLFQPVELQRVQNDARFPAVEQRYTAAFTARKQAARDYLAAKNPGTLSRYQASEKEFEQAHQQGEKLVGADFHDTNYIFMSYVTRYLPVGIVGLVVAVIFSAAMSSTSGEINSLATVTVIDIYRRHIKTNASDGHYLWASRLATIFWGCYAIGFAQFGRNFGALIEAVNMVGSLFYGGLLGVFVLAFFFHRVGANAAFYGVIAGEAAIFAVALFTKISFLWFNVIGCAVVVLVALIINGNHQSQWKSNHRNAG
jgi:Na+/proline symporter